jgi:hypothetical protein
LPGASAAALSRSFCCHAIARELVSHARDTAARGVERGCEDADEQANHRAIVDPRDVMRGLAHPAEQIVAAVRAPLRHHLHQPVEQLAVGIHPAPPRRAEQPVSRQRDRRLPERGEQAIEHLGLRIALDAEEDPAGDQREQPPHLGLEHHVTTRDPAIDRTLEDRNRHLDVTRDGRAGERRLHQLARFLVRLEIDPQWKIQRGRRRIQALEEQPPRQRRRPQPVLVLEDRGDQLGLGDEHRRPRHELMLVDAPVPLHLPDQMLPTVLHPQERVHQAVHHPELSGNRLESAPADR